jgi:hypothetical protein
VQLGVVLHRARAQRVEAGVEVEVLLRQAVEVAHDLRLGDLGQLGRPLPDGPGGKQVLDRNLGHFVDGCGESPAPLNRPLVDRDRVLVRTRIKP